jgi:hypothetical protein
LKKIILTIVIIGLTTLQINAQSATPGINKTQKNQQTRIREGVRSGELTKSETRKLEKQQVHIQRDKKIAKADGIVTINERKHIRSEQAIASGNIFRKKHNSRTKM